MSQSVIDKQQLLQGIKNWHKKWLDSGVGLPLEFYTEYRDILMGYKAAGETKERVYQLLMGLTDEHPELEELIYELLDMVVGYIGNPDLKIWW